ncbi:MAG: histidine phosphatase family protein [Anaerolineaceae bacterium]|nr:histidine phosphatase family protein [Anaerolineaceae bacterium]
MRIYFVRHGQSEANVLHQISNRGYMHGLTQLGQQQAEDLAQKLLAEVSGKRKLARIYTSPLQRAVETAQILSAHLGIPYETTGALREFDCGVAEGGADAHSWGLWQWVWDEWHMHRRFESKIEDGESYLDLVARFRPFVEGLYSSPEDLILIGHGGLFISMLPGLLVNHNLREQIPGDLGIPNTGFILAETCAKGLVCLEWCGVKILA